jgi:hypothetical protein
MRDTGSRPYRARTRASPLAQRRVARKPGGVVAGDESAAPQPAARRESRERLFPVAALGAQRPAQVRDAVLQRATRVAVVSRAPGSRRSSRTRRPRVGERGGKTGAALRRHGGLLRLPRGLRRQTKVRVVPGYALEIPPPARRPGRSASASADGRAPPAARSGMAFVRLPAPQGDVRSGNLSESARSARPMSRSRSRGPCRSPLRSAAAEAGERLRAAPRPNLPPLQRQTAPRCAPPGRRR